MANACPQLRSNLDCPYYPQSLRRTNDRPTTLPVPPDFTFDWDSPEEALRKFFGGQTITVDGAAGTVKLEAD